MLTPPLKPQTVSLIKQLKRAALPLGLISFGILNGTAGNPVLVLVGVVSGCLAFAQPYLDGRRANPTVKRAFLLMLGSLAFAFLSLTAAPARAQFFQNAAEGKHLGVFGTTRSGKSVLWNLVPKALEQIRLRLTYWANSRVGKAISSPSTVPTDSMLLVFALRQVSQSEDAAILSLVAYAAALRRAMASPMSIFFIDESPILFQFPEIAQLVAMLCANGAKAGIRVIITAQDPNNRIQVLLKNIETLVLSFGSHPLVTS